MEGNLMIERLNPTQYEIVSQLVELFEKHGDGTLAVIDIVSVLNSWGDTLPEEEILNLLKLINLDGGLFRVKFSEYNKSNKLPDEIMNDFMEGREAAKALVEHVLCMGACGTKLPVNIDGQEFEVIVKRKS